MRFHTSPVFYPFLSKKHDIFLFKSNITQVFSPKKLNNPFSTNIPEVALIAVHEFQKFLAEESKKWDYDFEKQKGKMFGVLVVKQNDGRYAYLGTVSGKLPNNAVCDQFVPSVFDESTGDYFINKGMMELTEISNKILESDDYVRIAELKEERSLKSMALQQRLFENYNFLNLSGEKKNVITIFKNALNSYPPVAAGECAAPKLLHYAFRHHLKPIAIAEFWWGGTNKNQEKQHKHFYPACKDRCRPILEYMLEDKKLFNQR